MAENGEKRSPTSHRTPGQIRRQVKGYDAQPEQRKKRAQRNKARAMMIKEGKAAKGDGKDVHHIKAVRHGGTNAKSNLAVVSRHQNRGWERSARKGPSRSGRS